MTGKTYIKTLRVNKNTHQFKYFELQLKDKQSIILTENANTDNRLSSLFP